MRHHCFEASVRVYCDGTFAVNTSRWPKPASVAARLVIGVENREAETKSAANV